MASKRIATCSAVVVAAGKSTRMGSRKRKPYLKLQGRPILSWTLSALGSLPTLREIILVTRPEDRKQAGQAADLAKLPRRVKIEYADGGLRRQDSVFNGLNATTPTSDLVMIHDAARPFPPKKAMQEALLAAAKHGASILAMPMRDTVKREAKRRTSTLPRINETVPRNDLWLAQTPQFFQRTMILRLFKQLASSAPDQEMTDDAAICEHFGKTVVLIESSSTNFKVTRPEDISIAETYLKLGLIKGSGK